MTNYGDFDPGDLVVAAFTTVDVDGVPFTLAGTPAVSAFKDDDTTPDTSGITLSVDYSTVTGLNHVAVDTSADPTFYSAGSTFVLVITTGTVDSASVVGYVVGTFSLQARSALMPVTAKRKALIAAGGHVAPDWAAIGSPTTTVALSGTTIKDTTDVTTALTALAAVAADLDARTVAALVNGHVPATLDTVPAEPAAAFTWGVDNLETILAFLGALATNPITETATTQTLRNRANTVDIATATVSDDGTTGTRGSLS